MSSILQADYDVAAIMRGLYGDGIIGLSGAFDTEWADRLHQDINRLSTRFGTCRAAPSPVARHASMLRFIPNGSAALSISPRIHGSSRCARRCLGRTRYEERMVRKFPRRGDISARSALTIHRGTANTSGLARPVLVVGVDAPDATNAGHHDLQVTAGYLNALPEAVRSHLTCRVVERLEPIVQHHQIEGLLKPAY